MSGVKQAPRPRYNDPAITFGVRREELAGHVSRCVSARPALSDGRDKLVLSRVRQFAEVAGYDGIVAKAYRRPAVAAVLQMSTAERGVVRCCQTLSRGSTPSESKTAVYRSKALSTSAGI